MVVLEMLSKLVGEVLNFENIQEILPVVWPDAQPARKTISRPRLASI